MRRTWILALLFYLNTKLNIAMPEYGAASTLCIFIHYLVLNVDLIRIKDEGWSTLFEIKKSPLLLFY